MVRFVSFSSLNLLEVVTAASVHVVCSDFLHQTLNDSEGAPLRRWKYEEEEEAKEGEEGGVARMIGYVEILALQSFSTEHVNCFSFPLFLSRTLGVQVDSSACVTTNATTTTTPFTTSCSGESIYADPSQPLSIFLPKEYIGKDDSPGEESQLRTTSRSKSLLDMRMKQQETPLAMKGARAGAFPTTNNPRQRGVSAARFDWLKRFFCVVAM